ncbi:GDSL esterase/lipase 7-like protein [Tanacetum coccineum]
MGVTEDAKLIVAGVVIEGPLKIGANYASATAGIIFSSGSKLNLYNANVRRMVVMGLGPIGCAPFYLWQYGSENEACIKMLNNMILEFNSLMRFTIEELLEELTDANIIFCDAFQDIRQYTRFILNGSIFRIRCDTACCGLGRYNRWMMCYSPGMACSNASYHLWWDQFHPMAAGNKILADNVWSGLHTITHTGKLSDFLTYIGRSADNIDKKNRYYACTSWLVMSIDDVDNKCCNYDA